VKWREAQLAFARGLAGEALPENLFAGDHIGERLAVYRGNVENGLIETLLAAYPTVALLTGADFARGMMRDFARAHPPAEACLARYGAALPDFIAAYQALPYLADAARLDWAVHEAYHAADDAALAPDALDETIRLRAHARLLQSPWPLLAIRDFCRAPEGELDISRPGGKLLVCRPGLDVEIVPLAAEEFRMLSLLRGKALPAALEEMLEEYPAFALGPFLLKFARLALFTSSAASAAPPASRAGT
jgi:hypothetical protein